VRLSTLAMVLALASPLGVVAQEPWPTRDWASASPAEVGLDAKVLAAFDADLAAGKYGLVDSRFNYNRGATERLAHVFRRATGHDVERSSASWPRSPGPSARSAERAGNPAGAQAVAATASRKSASILAASAYGS